jgi:tRNA nucleotidyltransferase (CCA-adding enzyme)
VELYKVGGAVRDELLGLEPVEIDWVVVGATPDDMRALGYRQVGRDFPVFLHPKTHEEYALARTERKTGAGHTDFECHAGPDVTLEDDLKRRDLTINAIARRRDGVIVDPWGGERDLDRRLLRHVSAAFVEDPLRVFRVARLAAQLRPYGFKVAPETLELMRSMSARGDLRALSAERVWQELVKALPTPTPVRFFEVLDECGGLADWFPECEGRVALIAELWSRLGGRLPEPLDRFGALGWVLPDRDLERLAERLKAPNDYRRLAVECARIGRELLRWREASGAELLEAGKQTGMLRQPDWFERLLALAEACGEADLRDLSAAAHRARQLSSDPFIAQGLSGPDLGRALDTERARILDEARTTPDPPS